MADIISNETNTDVTANPAEEARLDRRSFLRALSGSAITVVAGGLTVTLAACQGASTTNPVISSVTVPNTPVALPVAPSGSGNGVGSIPGIPLSIAGLPQGVDGWSTRV